MIETPLTKRENDGVDDEHSHYKTVESVVQDKPLDASPPGAAGAATRRHDGHDLIREANIQSEQGGVRFTRGFLAPKVPTYAKASAQITQRVSSKAHRGSSIPRQGVQQETMVSPERRRPSLVTR